MTREDVRRKLESVTDERFGQLAIVVGETSFALDLLLIRIDKGLPLTDDIVRMVRDAADLCRHS